MSSAEPSPAVVWSIIHGLTTYWMTAAGVELGVFRALAGREADVTHLATELDVSEAHLGVLLDGLAAVGLLTRSPRGYGLTPEADVFLVAGRPRYMGDLVLHGPGLPDNWPALANTVRTGSPPHPVDDCGPFFRRLVTATFAIQYAAAQRVVAELGAMSVDTILDLGAGAAPWAIALLEARPAARAVVNDLPEVIPEAAATLADHGVLDRAVLAPGDYHHLELEADAFDVVVLGHVCRSEGPLGAPVLIAKAAQALRPGGALVVADMLVDDERRASIGARLLGVTMMANTTRGATFTVSEVRGWLTGAGLSDIRVLEAMPSADVVIATKREGT